MRDLLKLSKALSDETRIRILKVLLERECCVCEVMQALDISPKIALISSSTSPQAVFSQCCLMASLWWGFRERYSLLRKLWEWHP